MEAYRHSGLMDNSYHGGIIEADVGHQLPHMFVGVNNDSEIQAIHGGFSAFDFYFAGKIRITGVRSAGILGNAT